MQDHELTQLTTVVSKMIVAVSTFQDKFWPGVESVDNTALMSRLAVIEEEVNELRHEITSDGSHLTMASAAADVLFGLFGLLLRLGGRSAIHGISEVIVKNAAKSTKHYSINEAGKVTKTIVEK